ncbi:hypothetical protein JSO19_03845 [Leucobacter sp. UCMA 4100]|uniref:hypothetical protein n=1 Tax=Leucobacter sp. UCMA 4100 TaxID=2810534 RepID=UPI0022EAA750|nr:hypothetical protein [Leucobacter sp. UCMA 4100]MDA3146508.1 hypothetical protein [Leucobacter sp. UCMA 4100]
MQAIQGNIGKEIKFFPQDKESGRAALAIISVAEKKYAPPTRDVDGKTVWAEPETIWHNDVMIRGNAAHRFKDTFQPGDPIIVGGNLGKATQKELPDGRVIDSTPFWVETFGFDGTKVKAEIDRAPRQSQSHDPARIVAQSHQASAAQQSVQEKPEETDMTNYQVVSDKLEHRLSELVDAQRVSETTKNAIMTAFASSSTPEEAQISVNTAVMQARLPMTENLYLTSVVGEAAGDGPALSWREAEKLHNPDNKTLLRPQPAPQTYAQ